MNNTTQTSLATVAPGQVNPTPPVAEPDTPGTVTAAQARVEGIAATLTAAYAKASTLKIDDAETAELTAPFPDEAVRRGAGGDPNLLYIEHAWVRERLHQVFKPGKWALINRRTWFDEVQGFMYAECVLVIRGCFVGEAIGAQRYSARNARLNYSDAVEGAQSEALRRIAGKYLGVGLQLWKKSWCDGWFARQKGGNAPTSEPTTATPSPEQAPSAPPSASVSGGSAVVTLTKFVERSGVGVRNNKPWKAWFVTFTDANNVGLEMGTFDAALAAKFPTLQGEICRVTYKPGKKPNTWELLTIEPADVAQPEARTEDDDVPS